MVKYTKESTIIEMQGYLMIISVIIFFIFAALLLITKAKNRYTWAISLTLCSLMVILTAQLLRIIKLYSYNSFIDFENLVYFALHKIKTSYYDIKLITNMGVAMYLLSMVAFGNFTMPIGKQGLRRIACAVGLLLPVVAYMFLNSYSVSENVYIMLSSAVNETQYRNAMLYSNLIVVYDYFVITSYMIMPFVFFWIKFTHTRILYRKKQIKILSVCLGAIDIFFVTFFMLGPLDNIITPSSQLFSFSAESSNFNRYIYVYIPAASLCVFVVMLWAVIHSQALDSVDFFCKKAVPSKSRILPSEIRHVFHSYKNAMFSIMVLQQKASKNFNNAEGRQALDEINEVAQSFISKTGEFIDIFNEINLNVSEVDVIHVIKKAIRRIKLIYDINISENFYKDTMYTYADEKKMSEMLHNIMINAVEAIEKKGSGDGLIQLGVYKEEQWICISVKDNGCGMTKRRMRNIYKPLFSSKKTYKNWGLGLSDAYNMVKNHNGIISVASKPGKYTEFQVLLKSSRKSRHTQSDS